MKNLMKVSLVLAVSALVLTGCNCYKKMAKNSERVQATVTPELLTLRGQNVTADITVTFGDKYFDKKAVARITPVLVYAGGQLEGSPKYLQGENVKDNYTTISYKNGGSYTQNVSFPYMPEANISTLEMVVEVQCKKGEFEEVARVPVARGVSIVQNYADWTEGLAIMPDNFKRVTTISETADIKYLVNSSNVRPAELRADQIKMFEEFVKENKDRDRTTLGSIYAKGYASPEGPVDFNDKLSRDRSNTGKDAITRELRSVPGLTYDAAAYGEDWEGFKTLVEQSNIRDKDLILQVLNMYSSPVQRDQEIKNMSAVYEVLKKDILPELRRTQLVASADISGKTDDELIAASKNNISSLNVEEMLFSATLTNDNSEKARIYKAAADQYNDVRAHNNYGVMLAKNGDVTGAKNAINRASQSSSATEISNNLGVLALIDGDVNEAKKYQSSMNATAKALLALADGDYANAVRGLDGYNLAIAEFVNGNIAKSKTAVGNTQTADADYLRAIIAMREGDTSAAQAHLNSAIDKDSSFREKSRNDIEFVKLY